MSIALPDDSENELLKQYDSDYQLAYDDLRQRLDDLAGASSADKRSMMQAVISAVEEAYDIIDQMATEVQSIPSNQRSRHNARLRGYRSDIDKAKREAKRISDNLERTTLFGDRNAPTPDGSTDLGSNQRQQLLSTQQRLEASSERLRDSQRVANETESIGASILNDLRGQREQIVNSRNTLSEADNYVDRSLRTLRGMARRMAANRLLTYAIIAVLIILILFVLASKFM